MTMKKNIKEAFGYFVAGAIFLLCTFDFIFPVIVFLFKACLFIIGCILILAGAGNLSECINKRQVTYDEKKEDTE